MKALITLILTFNTFLTFAQNVKFNIEGRIEDTKNAKYAYLSTLSQQIPISSDKIFMITPIVDGKFGFQGVFDLMVKHISRLVYLLMNGAIFQKRSYYPNLGSSFG